MKSLPNPETLDKLPALCSREYGARAAFRMMTDSGEYREYTFDGVDALSAGFSARLASRGVKARDRVGLYAPNSPDWPVTAFGVFRAGGILVPLDVRAAEAEFVFAAKDSGLRLILASDAHLDKAREFAPNGVTVVSLETEVAAASAGKKKPPSRSAAPDSLILISYTSGTTGEPKGVELSHRNLLTNARSTAERITVGTSDEILSVLPLTHVFEFTAGFLVPFMDGSTVTYARELSSDEITLNMQKTGTTVMVAVPLLFKIIYRGIRSEIARMNPVKRGLVAVMRKIGLAWPGAGKKLFGQVRKKFGGKTKFWASGGAPIDREVIEGMASFGIEIVQGYGLSETSPVISVCPPGIYQPGSVGPPLSWAEVRIDPSQGGEGTADVPGSGEILVRGPCVMLGYHGNEKATREVMTEDGFLRTGDLGAMDSDGFLTILGRAKNVIVTEAGKNVHPEEIEEAAASSDFIADICVYGKKQPGSVGETVAAVVVPAFERLEAAGYRDTSDDELHRIIAEELERTTARLAPYKHVTGFHIRRKQLPKTRTMKIRRMLVAEVAGQTREPTAETKPLDRPAVSEELSVSEREAIQEAVVETVADITGKPPKSISVEAGLAAEYGFDSLLRVELASQVERRLGRRIPDDRLASAATLRDIIEAVETAEEKKRKPEAFPGSLELQRRCGLKLARAAWFSAMRPFFKLCADIHVQGLGNIPDSGPMIIVPNHNSHFDSCAVLASVPFKRAINLHPVAASDKFFTPEKRALSWFVVLAFNVIPFDRRANFDVELERARDALRLGDSLIFFPEGWRGFDRTIGEFKPGVGYLAVEQQVPVVPAYIEGAENIMQKGRWGLRPGKVRVTYGRPVAPWPRPSSDKERFDTYRRFAAHVRERVIALIPKQPDTVAALRKRIADILSTIEE